MFLNHKIGDFLFYCLVVVAYVWGVVSFQHYIPAGTDFLVSLYSATILAVALFFFFTKQKIFKASITTVLWLVFFLLFIIQPVLHKPQYFDDVLLSALTMLLCVLLGGAIAGLNNSNKKQATIVMAWGLLLSGLFIVVSQIVQVLQWHTLDQILFMKTSSNRIAGNIAQANQAAYVLVMMLAAFSYLCVEYQQKISQHKLIVGIVASIVAFLSLFGIALTSSRGGILLLVCAVLGGVVLYKQNMKGRLWLLFGFIPAGVLGYLFGTDAIQTYNNDTMSAVGRLVGEGESLNLRSALLHQAWLAFKSSPITGIGWDNLKYFGLLNAEQIQWFTVANHSHNLVAQIAAEFGLLGLIPFFGFVWIGLKNLRLKMEHYQSFSYIILGLTFAYSLSEYPLWYFRFLLLTVFFVAMIDDSQLSIKNNISKVVAVISLLFVLGGGYYIKQYYRYADVSYAIQSDLTDYEQKVFAYQDLPNVFGYTKYKEMIFYMLNPISENNVEQQIQLGERVLSTYLDSFLMIKQANLYMAVGRQDEVDKLLRATCLFTTHIEAGDYCPDVVRNLQDNIKEYPKYQGYLDRLQDWHQERFGKPLPPPKQDRTERDE